MNLVALAVSHDPEDCAAPPPDVKTFRINVEN